MKIKTLSVLFVFLFMSTNLLAAKNTLNMKYGGSCLEVAIAAYDASIEIGLSHEQAETIAFKTLRFCYDHYFNQ